MLEVDPDPTLPRKGCTTAGCCCMLVRAASHRLIGQSQFLEALALEPREPTSGGRVFDFVPSMRPRRR